MDMIIRYLVVSLLRKLLSRQKKLEKDVHEAAIKLLDAIESKD